MTLTIYLVCVDGLAALMQGCDYVWQALNSVHGFEDRMCKPMQHLFCRSVAAFLRSLWGASHRRWKYWTSSCQPLYWCLCFLPCTMCERSLAPAMRTGNM